jgi:acetyl-CoA acetyltransferase
VAEDVSIIGAGMTRFGRFPELSLEQIGAEAALLALDDADLEIGDVQALHCGNVMQANAMPGQRSLRKPGAVDRTETDSQTLGTSSDHALGFEFPKRARRQAEDSA